MGIFLDNTYTTTMDKLFIKDLWGLVFEYTEPPVYSVRDWVLEGIKKKRRDWSLFSSEPKAIHLLEKNLDKVNWENLSGNPAAIHILEQNLDKVDWEMLSQNPDPAAIHILEQNLDKVDWELLSENPNIYVVDKKETRKLIKKKVDEFLE